MLSSWPEILGQFFQTLLLAQSHTWQRVGAEKEQPTRRLGTRPIRWWVLIINAVAHVLCAHHSCRLKMYYLTHSFFHTMASVGFWCRTGVSAWTLASAKYSVGQPSLFANHFFQNQRFLGTPYRGFACLADTTRLEDTSKLHQILTKFQKAKKR